MTQELYHCKAPVSHVNLTHLSFWNRFIKVVIIHLVNQRTYCGKKWNKHSSVVVILMSKLFIERANYGPVIIHLSAIYTGLINVEVALWDFT